MSLYYKTQDIPEDMKNKIKYCEGNIKCTHCLTWLEYEGCKVHKILLCFSLAE